MENKEGSQTQREKDFKGLVLVMLPVNEKYIIDKISASDLYYLVFGVYNTYSGVKEMLENSYSNLNLLDVYNIISNLHDIKSDLKKQINEV